MNFEDLKKYCPEVEILWGSFVSIESISTPDDPVDGTICFMKTKKFHANLGRLSEKNEFLGAGVLLEESFAKDEKSQDVISDLKSKFGWGAVVKNVNVAMTKLSRPFYDKKFAHLNYHIDGRQLGSTEISVDAEIAQNVFIGENVKIGARTIIMPGSVIMANSEIGTDCVIYPNVTVYPYCKIGDGCRLHASVVIGSDGFGYNFFDGAHQKVWHFSGVVIGNNVEIGANSSVNSGAFYPTTIGDGTKLDDDVLIGHNTKVGKHCILCGQVCLGGSSELEDFCVMGGNAGLSPGAKLGKGVQVAARGTISENVTWEGGQVLAGTPAQPLKDWMKFQAKLRRLVKDN